MARADYTHPSEYVGERYGKLICIDFEVGEKAKDDKLILKCDCSEVIIKPKQGFAGKNFPISCGCAYKRYTKEARRNTHGEKTHGMSKTPAYRVWNNMKTRCNNPNNAAYKRYGGRGITYDERWSRFENFLEDMGPPDAGMTLERLDVNGNYTKDNCIWADRKTQSINRHKPDCGKNQECQYKGVNWSRRYEKYTSTCYIGGIYQYLGRSLNPELLALRYDAVVRLHGYHGGTNKSFGLVGDTLEDKYPCDTWVRLKIEPRIPQPLKFID